MKKPLVKSFTDKQLKDCWAYQVQLTKYRGSNVYVNMLIPDARIRKAECEREMDARGIPWNIMKPKPQSYGSTTNS